MCESWVYGTWKSSLPGRRKSEGAYKVQKGEGGTQPLDRTRQTYLHPSPSSLLSGTPLLLACVLCVWRVEWVACGFAAHGKEAGVVSRKSEPERRLGLPPPTVMLARHFYKKVVARASCPRMGE